MTTGWFLAPYKRRPGRFLPARYCAMDDATIAIVSHDGAWSEAEIDGNRALVRVRAPAALLPKLQDYTDVPIRPVDDPAKLWTPTRQKPCNRDGDVVFQPNILAPCLSLDEVDRLVLDDDRWGEIVREAEALARRSDVEGYVRLPKGGNSDALLGLLNRWGYGHDKVSTGT